MYNVTLTEAYFPAHGRANPEPVAPEPLTIGDMLNSSVRATPDQLAIKQLLMNGDIGRTWTYQELHSDTQRLARALASRHAQGARIAVYANNCPEWVLLELACALAGIILVTVNPAYQPRELKFVLEQSASEAIYYLEEFRGNKLREIADSVCDDLPAIKYRILLSDHQALFDGEDTPFSRTIKPSDPIQIQYTSGTTGFPKGALLHHNGLVKNATDTLERCCVQKGDVFVHYMPMFHTTGCAILNLGGLAHSATIIIAPLFDPALIVRTIESERANFIFGVPTMLVALVQAVRQSGCDVSSVKTIGSGGSMVAPDLCRSAREILGAPVQILYGQTETSPVITHCWYDDTLEDMTQTIGQPLPHIEVTIRNPHTNEVCAVDEQGEICCRGYLVMTGYNNNVEATQDAIDENGWLHTGDLGRMDSRGYVKITGRVKEMIIRGGENLFPAEIENAMLEHDDICEVAVIGVPDEKWGEQVACFMRSDTANQPESPDLKAFIRERLSPQKTPVFWIWVDEWPLTGSGKIQKFKLLEGLQKGQYGNHLTNGSNALKQA